MPMTVPNDIINGTPVDAIPVEQNYNVIEQYINTNTVLRDGSVAMTGQLTLVGNPVQATHAVPKSYVDTILPVGVIMDYGGAAAPAGGNWMLCNGASLSVTAYPDLFNVIKFAYGGSGGTFKLPDYGSRVGIGVDADVARFNAVGKKGGSTKVPVPSHTHTINHDHGSATSGGQSVNHTHEHAHTHKIDHNHGSMTTTSGGAHLHTGRVRNNMPSSGSGTVVSAVLNGGDPNYNGTGFVNNGNTASGEHTHAIDLPAFVGNSGAVSEATTGINSAGHTHSVNLPAFSGASGAYKLEITDPDNSTMKSTTDHYQPYLVCNKIIKVK